MLLVPKNDTNLRSRYACSLLCLELPTQKTESGPESLRSASSRSRRNAPAHALARFHQNHSHLLLGEGLRGSQPCGSGAYDDNIRIHPKKNRSSMR